MDALAAAHDAAVQMIETSLVHVHQHGACIAGNIEQHMADHEEDRRPRFMPSWTQMACPSNSAYHSDCQGCHVPAKATDWSYVNGYPVLRH